MAEDKFSWGLKTGLKITPPPKKVPPKPADLAALMELLRKGA